jgi:hypothetical protein
MKVIARQHDVQSVPIVATGTLQERQRGGNNRSSRRSRARRSPAAGARASIAGIVAPRRVTEQGPRAI